MKYKTVPCTVNTQICGKYYLVSPSETIEISETAYACLEYLKQGADIRDLCQGLEDKYEIEDKEVLLSDVTSLVKDLFNKRLLMRC